MYTHFPYLSSNITEANAYGVLVSQLICYARVCSKYEDFLFKGSILVTKLLKQGYSSCKRQTTIRKFHGRHTYLVHKYICRRVCSPTVTYDWFPIVLG